ncbi:remorin [Capsicum galapagoense]
MSEEEAKKVETAEAVAEEKAIVLSTLPPSEDKSDDSKALAIVEPESNAALALLTTEKRLSLIKAWEESEKSKAENKAQKKISEILAWENSKKASLEADLKMTEEQLLKKKAEYIEKMKNKIARLHKSAEEKRAIIEAKRGEKIFLMQRREPQNAVPLELLQRNRSLDVFEVETTRSASLVIKVCGLEISLH